MNRRDFLKRTASTPVAYMLIRTGGVVAIADLGMGISCQTVLQDINGVLVEIGPELQIVLALLPLLGAKSIPPNVISAITKWEGLAQTDIANLETYFQQVQNDIATNPTVQAKIAALVQTAEEDTDSILTVLQVLDVATRAKIENLVNAIGGSIISVENMILKLEGKTSLKAAKTVSGGPFVVTSQNDVITKFNAQLHAPTNDVVIDVATAQLSLKKVPIPKK